MGDLICQPGRYDRELVTWLFGQDERVRGCRVRQVGHLCIEIHNMLTNLRVVITDCTDQYGPGDFGPIGYAWCYPKEFGYPFVAGLVWAWAFCKDDPGKVDPPGPWIKAVHTGEYREPKSGQQARERTAIWCPGCGQRSTDSEDIAKRYCVHCRQFHELIGWRFDDR